MTEDEIVGWNHGLNGHGFEQALGVGDEQGSLVCCSPCSHKVHRVGHNFTTKQTTKTVSLKFSNVLA